MPSPPKSYEPLVLHRNELFYVAVLANQRPRVVVTGPWSPAIAAYMAEHELTDISLNWGMGWDGGGVDFLEQMPPLRSVAILDSKTTDLTPLLQHRGTLQDLVLECKPKRVFELSKLPALTRLCFNWAPGFGGLLDGQPHGLRNFIVQNWPFEDLSRLSPLRELEQLTIVGSRQLHDVKEVRDWLALRELTLHDCRKLEDFRVIGTCRGLQELTLNCLGARDIEFTSALAHLRVLILGKRDIPTLAPLAACTELIRFATSGRVLDADLSVFLRLPKFERAVMANRREYKPTVAEVNDACSHRRTG